MNEDLIKVVLVPIEVFGAESYGLSDAVSPWSDCNRAVGHMYRREDNETESNRNPEDVITIYVPRDEVHKFDKEFVA